MSEFNKIAYFGSIKPEVMKMMTKTDSCALMMVYHYSDKDGRNAYASAARIAKDCGCSEKSAQTALTHLRELKLIEREKVGGRRGNRNLASEYRLARIVAADSPTGKSQPVKPVDEDDSQPEDSESQPVNTDSQPVKTDSPTGNTLLTNKAVPTDPSSTDPSSSKPASDVAIVDAGARKASKICPRCNASFFEPATEIDGLLVCNKCNCEIANARL